MRHDLKVRSLAVGLLTALLSLGTAAEARGQKSGCELVTPAEAKALLGADAAGVASGRGCHWGKVGGPAKALLLISYAMPAAQQQMAWAGMQRSAQSGGHAVTQEPGVSADAFSVAESFGGVMMIRKGGAMVQLQFHVAHGGGASKAELDALRAVAKAVASRI